MSPAARRAGAIGVLEDAGRYLMVRRARGLHDAGHWCFPGGRLEPGETSRDAVARELAEEVGLEVAPSDAIGHVRLEGSEWELAVHRVSRIGGTLTLHAEEVDAARWMTASEIRSLDSGLPSNLEVLALLGGEVR